MKKKEYELIAFDMDGTLLNSKKHISEKTQKAIEMAVNAGKKVVISSGRAVAEFADCEEELKSIRYAVCANGAVLYDNWEKKILHREVISEELIEKILLISQGEDLMPYYFSCGRAITEGHKIKTAKRYHMEQYRPMMERVCTVVDDVWENYEKTKPSIEKFNFYCATREIRDTLKEKLDQLPLSVKISENSNMEITSLGVTKASGLQKLSEILEVSEEKVIAVGDADNDIDMLKMAGFSIAMGNALPEVKEICDVVVKDNDHDGCEEAIMKYLLA